ncbi:ESPR domain-containing protein [Neisseria cinerea]
MYESEVKNTCRSDKTFKVIWNHSTQTWTAVSELAGTRKKANLSN